ncbi:MAG TPA: gamma-glutamylcyclotransferase [bacterium]|nr:gamma-glutamylcyclotransferase [bacterium]
MLYFAYGSNMNWEQMRQRCASARQVCVALLPDHCLAFTRYSSRRGCGVADAVPAAGEAVWGVVYELDEMDLAALDRHEGYLPGRERNAYHREARTVYEEGRDDRPREAQVYFAEREDDPPLPNTDYVQTILDGAAYWGLPAEYLSRLKKTEVTG